MKVLIGGFVAGLIINLGQSIVHLVILAEESAAMTAAMGSPEPTGQTIAIFWILGWVIGLTMVFMYAAMRPRCGAGPMAAVYAAVTVFVLSELVPTAFFAAGGVIDLGQYLPFMIATLIILCVAAVGGAALYSEDEHS